MKKLKIFGMTFFGIAAFGSLINIRSFFGIILTLVLSFVAFSIFNSYNKSKLNTTTKVNNADRKPLSYSIPQQIYPTVIEKGIKNIDFIYDFNKMPSEFIVVDVETTGLDSTYDKIIEVAVLKYKDGKIVEEFSQLINPEMSIPGAATKVNGITNDMVKDKPNIFEVIDIIFDKVNGEIVVGYNVKFDIGFIDIALARSDRCVENIKVLDVLDIVKTTFTRSETTNFKLATMKEYFGIENESHRALSDCRTTLEIMKKCIATKENKRLETISKFNENEKAFISILEQRLHEIGFVGDLQFNMMSDKVINFKIKGMQIGRVKLNGRKYKMQILDKNNSLWLDIDNYEEAIENLKHWIKYSKHLLKEIS